MKYLFLNFYDTLYFICSFYNLIIFFITLTLIIRNFYKYIIKKLYINVKNFIKKKSK